MNYSNNDKVHSSSQNTNPTLLQHRISQPLPHSCLSRPQCQITNTCSRRCISSASNVSSSTGSQKAANSSKSNLCGSGGLLYHNAPVKYHDGTSSGGRILQQTVHGRSTKRHDVFSHNIRHLSSSAAFYKVIIGA